MFTIYRITCIVPDCKFVSKWRTAEKPEDIRRVCLKCMGGAGTGVEFVPNIEQTQIDTLDNALSFTNNKIQFVDPTHYDRTTWEKENRDRLAKIWAAAIREGVAPKLFEALLYVGSYAHGARLVAVEDARNPEHMSFEFVGLTKEGTPFIHIGAIYRPSDKEWSFHS